MAKKLPIKYCIVVPGKGFLTFEKGYTVKFAQTYFTLENKAIEISEEIPTSYIIPMDLWRSTFDKFFNI